MFDSSLRSLVDDLNLKRIDALYFILLTVFGFAISVYMIKFNMTRGVFNSDVYIYLANALNFAGLNTHGISDPSWSFTGFVIYFFTALLFKLGFVDIKSIFIVTGCFSVLAIYGMHVLLRQKFNPLLSFTGSILFTSFSLTLFSFGNGMLDLPAVALVIWTLIFTVMAVDRNSKYYVLVGIAFVVSFFIRYTTGFTIFLIFLYFIKNHDVIDSLKLLFVDFDMFKKRFIGFIKSSEFKNILLAIGVSAVLSAIILAVILSTGSSLSFFGTGARSAANGLNYRTMDSNFRPDKYFYLKNYLSFLFCDNITYVSMIEQFNGISFISYLLVLIIGGGFLLKLKEIIKNNSKINIKHAGLIIALMVISILGIKFTYIISIISFIAVYMLIIHLWKRDTIENYSFYGLMFALFYINFAVFSFVNVKCARYILTTFPAFTFFVIYYLNVILDYIDNWQENKRNSSFSFRISNIIPILFILLLLFTAFNFSDTVEIPEESTDFFDMVDFIKEYDPDYQSKVIFSSFGVRYLEWYMDANLTVLHSKMDLLNADYFLTRDPVNGRYFHEIFNGNGVYVYERN